ARSDASGRSGTTTVVGSSGAGAGAASSAGRSAARLAPRAGADPPLVRASWMAATRSLLRIRAVPLRPTSAATAWRSASRMALREPPLAPVPAAVLDADEVASGCSVTRFLPSGARPRPRGAIRWAKFRRAETAGRWAPRHGTRDEVAVGVRGWLQRL